MSVVRYYFYLMGYDNKHTVKSLPLEKTLCISTDTRQCNLKVLCCIKLTGKTDFIHFSLKKIISRKTFSLPSITVVVYI